VDVQLPDALQVDGVTIPRVDQLPLFGTLEEAEAIAEERRSQVRDRVVRLLQDEVREGREASEA